MWTMLSRPRCSPGVLAASLLLLGVLGPQTTVAQGGAAAGGFTPGRRDILTLTFASTPLGEIPEGLDVKKGNLEVVDKNGVHMLRASSPSEFLIHLPETLPKDFTLEFDLIAKACCQPEDLAVEGTRRMGRDSVSAQIVWDRETFLAVGGGTYFQAPMPDSLAKVLPSQLAHVNISFQGETVKLYTNGQPLVTLSNRKFMRDSVLRVFLGGQDEAKHAVYLARLRIAASSAGAVATTQSASSGSGLSNALGSGATGTLTAAGGGTVPVPVSGTATTTVSAPSNPGITAGPLPAGTVAPTPAQTAATQPTLSSPTNPLATVVQSAIEQQQNAATAQLPFVSASVPAPVAASTGPVSSLTGPAGITSRLAGPAEIYTVSLASNQSAPGWGILIAWSPVANATTYRVSRAVAGSRGAPISVINVPAAWVQGHLAAVDPNVEPGMNYSYWVEGVQVSGVLTNPSTVSASNSSFPTAIGNLRATVTGTTQVMVPSTFGTSPVAGSNVTWSWDPLPTAFVYETSYEIVGSPGIARKTLRTTLTMPPTIAPIAFGVPQGSSVKFCVSVWAVPDPRQPLPSTATCLTTQVP